MLLTLLYPQAQQTTLTEADIQAIADAIWSKSLPLSAAPVLTYGSTTLNSADLSAIAHATWSKSLP